METTAGTGTGGAGERGAEPSPGEGVGRYTIERILGAGGMGVVYAAHDPDLDRRIALKILRQATGRDQTQARARLLREARAMAKLSHPNVITVHEVGTDGSRDFVAMELIDGKNVADWLAERRPVAEVLRVMLAAGRGLAAAHAAGLVHRDFKPHNVLLGRDGRVVVTDFGLARAFEGEGEVLPAAPAAPAATGFEETVDAPARTPRPDSSSLSSTLTATGAMLGTPAYMAPEQFAGGHTGPETDQFAFCVALWEGLAGTRPFRGGSIDELRRAVEQGDPLGEGDVPRRYRRVLGRGLRRDPAARWPSMDALLAALVRAERRPRRIGAAIAFTVALAASGAAFVLTRPEAARVPAACAPAELMLWPVWSPGRAAALERRFASEPARWGETRAGLDAFARGWRDTWQTTCARADEPRFHARIACLTGALDELAAVTTTLAELPPEALRMGSISEILAPPDGCLDATRTGYPRPPEDPEVAAEVARLRRELALARTWARARRADDAKAKAAAALAAARELDVVYPAILAEALEAAGTVHHVLGEGDEAEPLYEDAAMVAERAGHDPVRAVALLGTLELVAGRSSDGKLVRGLAQRAAAAIERAGNDPALRAGVDLNLARLAVAEGKLDEAVRLAEGARRATEAAHDRRRAGRAAQHEAAYRMVRDGPGDLARARELVESALAAAEHVYGAEHPETLAMVRGLAEVRWESGDLAGAHELYARLASAPATDDARPDLPLIRGAGRVVDGSGAPVAGAEVFAGKVLVGDPLTLIFDRVLHRGWGFAEAVAGADGRFTIEAPAGALVVAQHGDLRAAPAFLGKDTRLVVRETGAVTGRIDLRGGPGPGEEATLARARAARIAQAGVTSGTGHSRFVMIGPVDDDHTWHVPGIPAGRYHAVTVAVTLLGDFHQRFQPIDVPAGGAVEVGQTLDLDGVVLDVIVRSDRAGSIPSAEVHVIPGTKRPRSIEDLFQAFARAGRAETGYAAPVDGHTGTRAGTSLYRDDDIHTVIAAVPPGDVVICVIPFGGDLADSAFLERMAPHVGELEMTCDQVTVPASPAIQGIVIETPPMKRLD